MTTVVEREIFGDYIRVDQRRKGPVVSTVFEEKERERGVNLCEDVPAFRSVYVIPEQSVSLSRYYYLFAVLVSRRLNLKTVDHHAPFVCEYTHVRTQLWSWPVFLESSPSCWRWCRSLQRQRSHREHGHIRSCVSACSYSCMLTFTGEVVAQISRRSRRPILLLLVL